MGGIVWFGVKRMSSNDNVRGNSWDAVFVLCSTVVLKVVLLVPY